MKKLFLVTAALAGMSAVPALAADPVRPVAVQPLPVVVQRGPQVQAWVGADVGWYQLSKSGTSLSGYTLGASGAANVPLMGGPFNIEIEARASDTNIDLGGNADLAVGAGYLHAFYRTPGWAFGAFAGFEDVFEIGLRTAGVEAQFYGQKFNLYGQVAGIGTSVAGISGSAWWARGGVQWFPTPNFLIGGDVRFVNVSISGSSLTSTLWGLNAEWRGTGQAFSLYAQLTSQTASASGTSLNLTKVLGGIRIHVGNGSLQEQYSTGASMNVLPSAL